MSRDEEEKGGRVEVEEVGEVEARRAEVVEGGGAVAGGGGEADPEVTGFECGELAGVESLDAEALEGMCQGGADGFGRVSGGVFTEENVGKEDDGHERDGTAFGLGEGGEEEADHGSGEADEAEDE